MPLSFLTFCSDHAGALLSVIMMDSTEKYALPH